MVAGCTSLCAVDRPFILINVDAEEHPQSFQVLSLNVSFIAIVSVGSYHMYANYTLP